MNSTEEYYCNFETDLCGMTQDIENADFVWEHEKGEEGFELPGGGYLIADSIVQDPDAKAVIMTPFINFLGPQCVKFK